MSEAWKKFQQMDRLTEKEIITSSFGDLVYCSVKDWEAELWVPGSCCCACWKVFGLNSDLDVFNCDENPCTSTGKLHLCPDCWQKGVLKNNLD